MNAVGRVLTLVIALGVTACGGGDAGTGNPPPVAVGSVVVTLANSTIAPGTGTSATALVRDAGGNTLTGRAVNWSTSNPAVATVNAGGAVTAVADGSATITATSEGKSGGATLAVSSPVTQVAISGTARVKVGDTYQYTAEARLADNTLVQRLVTWTVVEPGKGTITQAGVLTPLATGAITVRATVENVFFNGAVTGYDWAFASDGITSVVALPADVAISNKFNQSEYPSLVVGCTSNFFALFFSTDGFVTHNGLVSFSFDNGSPSSQVWDESSDFSSLFHPGPTNLATKTFVNAVAASRIFAFAFTEFNGPARATAFRVARMATAVAPIFVACPSNAVMGVREAGDDPIARMRALAGYATSTASVRGDRVVAPGYVQPSPAMALGAVTGPQRMERLRPR